MGFNSVFKGLKAKMHIYKRCKFN